jgi:hypothetical protein
VFTHEDYKICFFFFKKKKKKKKKASRQRSGDGNVDLVLWFPLLIQVVVVTLMSQTTLRRKHLLELDDIDQAYKRARLMKYLHDATTSNYEAESNTFNSSEFGFSSISTTSSISSADTSLSVTPSEIGRVS